MNANTKQFNGQRESCPFCRRTIVLPDDDLIEGRNRIQSIIISNDMIYFDAIPNSFSMNNSNPITKGYYGVRVYEYEIISDPICESEDDEKAMVADVAVRIGNKISRREVEIKSPVDLMKLIIDLETEIGNLVKKQAQ